MGYGLKRGGEAAVHSTRLYLKPQQVLLKVDVKNAVKTVRRDKMLTAVRVLAPDLLHFVHSTYPSPSFVWGDKSLQSSEGMQQGDPLGPLVDPVDTCLLGYPIGDVGSISNTIDEKVYLLGSIRDRLSHLAAQDAILLLCNSFAIPKLLYTLITSPCFLSPNLVSYDDRLRFMVSSITNIHFNLNDPAWIQASLPVKYGGHGIWSAVQLVAWCPPPPWLLLLAPPIFPITSSFTSSERPLSPTLLSQLNCGLRVTISPSPIGSASHRQKTWDIHKVTATVNTLLDCCIESVPFGCLLYRVLSFSPCPSYRLLWPQNR